MVTSPIESFSAPTGYDSSAAPITLSVAAASLAPAPTDKAKTLEKMETLVDAIRSERPDIEIIAFGELCLSWYQTPANYRSPDGKTYARDMAESADGASISAVSAMAVSRKVCIAFGMGELDADTLYNTQYLCYPDGSRTKYRKSALNEINLAEGFTAGTESVIVPLCGTQAALFICSDMQNQSVVKTVANSGAKIVLDSLTSQTRLNDDVHYLGVILNRWVIYANRSGTEDGCRYDGFACIISPTGTIVAKTDGTVVYACATIGVY